MGEETAIGWTDATMNFWIGCGEVGPGCDGCYAHALVTNRLRSAVGDVWGLGKERYRTMERNWKKPAGWNAYRELGFTEMRAGGRSVKVPLWVFALSLGDFFDNDVPDEWREDAWQVIRKTPLLRWQLVTKRLPNVGKMLPQDWNFGENYRHVGIIASVVTQKEYDRDIVRVTLLKDAGIKWIGLSIEPQLEMINLMSERGKLAGIETRLDWVIGGGESVQSHHQARMYDLDWGLSLIAQCGLYNIPYFQKQVGSNAFFRGERFTTNQRAGTEPGEWPEELRVQMMPRVYDQQGAMDGKRDEGNAQKGNP